jgi:Trypsin
MWNSSSVSIAVTGSLLRLGSWPGICPSRPAMIADRLSVGRRTQRAAAIATLYFAFASCDGGGLPAEVECTRTPITGGSARAEFAAIHPLQELAICQIQAVNRSMGNVAYCSGTLVSATKVLTAAHCIPGETTDVVAVFGADAMTSTARVLVARTVVHETLDLALLELEPSALESVGALPIPVNFEGAAGLGNLVQIAGFGFTERGRFGQRKFAVVRIQGAEPRAFTVYADRRAAACDGDSGGPALARDSNGGVVVAGVLSTGTASCGDVDSYVDVVAAVDWLKSNGVSRSADGPVLADCAFIEQQGRCFGDLALWCDGETARTQKCEAGTSCGFDNSSGTFRCVPLAQDPCSGVSDRGRCDGDNRIRCTEGQLVVSPCAQCNATCQFSIRNGKAICNAAGSD